MVITTRAQYSTIHQIIMAAMEQSNADALAQVGAPPFISYTHLEWMQAVASGEVVVAGIAQADAIAVATRWLAGKARQAELEAAMAAADTATLTALEVANGIVAGRPKSAQLFAMVKTICFTPEDIASTYGLFSRLL
jgi:hypothetical protein